MLLAVFAVVGGSQTLTSCNGVSESVLSGDSVEITMGSEKNNKSIVVAFDEALPLKSVYVLDITGQFLKEFDYNSKPVQSVTIPTDGMARGENMIKIGIDGYKEYNQIIRVK